eukprot:366489-Chlamydomonas_euryale.AAC.2
MQLTSSLGLQLTSSLGLQLSSSLAWCGGSRFQTAFGSQTTYGPKPSLLHGHATNVRSPGQGQDGEERRNGQRCVTGTGSGAAAGQESGNQSPPGRPRPTGASDRVGTTRTGWGAGDKQETWLPVTRGQIQGKQAGNTAPGDTREIHSKQAGNTAARHTLKNTANRRGERTTLWDKEQASGQSRKRNVGYE